MNIEPLRKRKTSGELYTWRLPIMHYIEKGFHWSFSDLLDCASIRQCQQALASLDLNEEACLSADGRLRKGSGASDHLHARSVELRMA